MMGEFEPPTVRAKEPAPQRSVQPPLLPGPDPVSRTRVHALTLCCAQSVAPIVGEVGRALGGLGFQTEVVTGSDARAAILDRGRSHDRPTIYVVCVQGALKDTVVGPLRQALATHGGPDEHLFVAVLDLSLPLSMVGQVRRFAEALERMPSATRPDPVQERRQWRQHSGSRVIDEHDTSTYRAVKRDQVPKKRASTAPPPIRAKEKAARVQPTRKYRAVTGPSPALPPEPGPSTRKYPAAERSTRGDAPRTNRKRVKVPGLETRTVPEEGHPLPSLAANFGAAIAEPSRPSAVGRLGKVLAVALLLGGAAYGSYRLGAYDGLLPTDLRAGAVAQRDDTLADEYRADDESGSEPAADDDAQPVRAGAAADSDDQAPDAAADDTDDAAPLQPADAESEAVAGDAEPELEPEPAASDTDESIPEPAARELGLREPPAEEPEPITAVDPDLSPAANPRVETLLADAIERRDVKVSNKYYVSTPERSEGRWESARRACREFEVEGVDDWRLPHRRELQLLGAIGMLQRGSYWSFTADPSDDSFAFVYERPGRRLSSWEKTEPAQIICVRKRS